MRELSTIFLLVGVLACSNSPEDPRPIATQKATPNNSNSNNSTQSCPEPKVCNKVIDYDFVFDNKLSLELTLETLVSYSVSVKKSNGCYSCSMDHMHGGSEPGIPPPHVMPVPPDSVSYLEFGVSGGGWGSALYIISGDSVRIAIRYFSHEKMGEYTINADSTVVEGID